MVGSLMYLTPRYQAKPTKKHLEAIKHADHAGCQDSRRSTSGSAQSLGDSWLAGHQRSKEARPSQQQRQNTLQCLDAVIKSFG
ncbi:hypothetical protein Tco_0544848 [Tanacetum coccineum]